MCQPEERTPRVEVVEREIAARFEGLDGLARRLVEPRDGMAQIEPVQREGLRQDAVERDLLGSLAKPRRELAEVAVFEFDGHRDEQAISVTRLLERFAILPGALSPLLVPGKQSVCLVGSSGCEEPLVQIEPAVPDIAPERVGELGRATSHDDGPCARSLTVDEATELREV